MLFLHQYCQYLLFVVALSGSDFFCKTTSSGLIQDLEGVLRAAWMFSLSDGGVRFRTSVETLTNYKLAQHTVSQQQPSHSRMGRKP